MKVDSPLAKPVPVVNIKLKVDSPLVQHVPVVLTVMLVPQVVYWMQLLVPLEPMTVEQQPFVMYVVLDNTTNKQVKLLVKIAMWDNTKNLLDNPLAKRVPVVIVVWTPLDALKSECTRYARVASVATVLVRVKLPRPPRVRQGRRR